MEIALLCVVLDSGEFMRPKRILSSAGIIETQRLVRRRYRSHATKAGQLTFIESDFSAG